MKIELRNVTKQYLYGAKVLTSVDLTVHSGEIVALLGGCGSGKTTLLKVIAGVEGVSSGEVLFDGEKKELKSDDVQMIFDDGALFKRWNIFDNLAYSLKIRKVEKNEIARKIMRVADDLDITSLLSFRPSSLTLADKKRVSIARVLLRDQKVLLIDDIGAGLDMVERQALWNELSVYLKTCGKTVVFATTQADEASSVADRIVALHRGEFKQVGSANEIYNHPQSIWAVELLDENFCFDDAVLTFSKCNVENGVSSKTESTIQEKDSVASAELNVARQSDLAQKLCLQIGETKIELPYCARELISQNYIGKTVLFGAHPQDFELSKNGVECEVEIAKGLPNGEYIVHFSNGWKMKTDQKLSGTVKVLPKADKLFLFDKASECSILK